MLICHPRRPSALVLMVRLADVVVVRLRLAGELIAGNAVRDVLRLTAHAAVSIEADRVVVRHAPSIALSGQVSSIATLHSARDSRLFVIAPGFGFRSG